MERGTASWMDEDPLPRVAPWVIARLVCVGCGLWPHPVGHGIELEAVAVCHFFSFLCDYWRCVRLFCGCCFVVCALCDAVSAVGRGILFLVRAPTTPRRCVCVLARTGVRLAVVLLLPCVPTRGRNGNDGCIGISPSLVSEAFGGRGFV
ncbi:putative retrotransposon hot spot (RHS) protein [Trypanosoma cruzi]|nr:putative retrotransposon hot spot (RHS) protein [Trypanosoma cruzi]